MTSSLANFNFRHYVSVRLNCDCDVCTFWFWNNTSVLARCAIRLVDDIDPSFGNKAKFERLMPFLYDEFCEACLRVPVVF